jgi:hypothetical protein
VLCCGFLWWWFCWFVLLCVFVWFVVLCCGLVLLWCWFVCVCFWVWVLGGCVGCFVGFGVCGSVVCGV